MKCVIVLSLVVGAMAELPRFKPARFRFQRQELAPSTTDMPETTTDFPGYEPSGWKPAGEPFTLPQETPTESPPDAPYPASGWKPVQPFTLPQEQSPPAPSYGIPDNSYGPPTTPTTDPKETLDGPIEMAKSVGTYYVLLPNGQLQRVEFVSENDIQNMKYTARLQLRDRAPLYVFGP